MFIKSVVEKIWEPKSKEYEVAYNNAIKFNVDELMDMCQNEIIMGLSQIHSIDSPLFSEIMLPSSGCPHCLKNGVFSGCCFCDYVSDHVSGMARINVLKKKDKNAYIKLMRFAFEKARGVLPEARISEVVTSYDTLNSDEFPDELYQELFASNGLYSKKPFQMEFETRASSITKERLLYWKKNFPVKRVMVRLGVEVKNEWVRNHWLNKNITNEQLENAVNCIHDVGWKANANILLGLPGLTEKQSVDLCVESALWAYELGFDTIVISYLKRVGYSLQNYLYNNMKNNHILNSFGVCDGERTALLSIYSFYEVFEKLVKVQPDIAGKIGFSVFYTEVQSEMMMPYYEEREISDIIKKATNVLLEFNQKRNIDMVLDMKKELEQIKEYDLHIKNIEKQKTIGGLHNNLLMVGKELSKQLWPDEWEERYSSFEDEIKEMDV